jgi:hypothetical protein
MVPCSFLLEVMGLVWNDLLILFNDFYHGRLDISRFNYGIISLVFYILIVTPHT